MFKKGDFVIVDEEHNFGWSGKLMVVKKVSITRDVYVHVIHPTLGGGAFKSQHLTNITKYKENTGQKILIVLGYK